MARYPLFVLLGLFFFTACNSAADRGEETFELTKGLITEMQEVDTNQFRIIDERVVENKADSRIIAHYLDGTTDTMTLDEAQTGAARAENPTADNVENNDNHRRHYYGGYGFYSVLRGGLFGYYLGRNFSVPPSAGVYMDQNTYNRVSNNAGQTLRQTARRTTVRRPSRSTSGYGSRRSTRSYGG